MTDARQAIGWRGHRLLDRNDEQIGTIAEIYVDDQTERREWALVDIGLPGNSLAFVPIVEATADGDDVRVPVDKDTVQQAPSTEPDGHLSPEEEAALYRHYGMDYSPAGGEVDTSQVADGFLMGGTSEVPGPDSS